MPSITSAGRAARRSGFVGSAYQRLIGGHRAVQVVLALGGQRAARVAADDVARRPPPAASWSPRCRRRPGRSSARAGPRSLAGDLQALNSAASTTTAVPCWSSWKTGMSSSAFSRSSISKQRGAEMSSRLIPPKVGRDQLAPCSTISSGSLVSRQIGNASTPANSLKSIALPSITGIAARGPMSPSPSTAVPSETTATVLRLIVYWKALSGPRGSPGRRGPRRGVGHREVVAGLQRVLVVLLDLAAHVHLERAVGGVDHPRAVERVERADDRVPVLLVAASTVMSRTVRPSLTRPGRPRRSRRRPRRSRRDAAEHARAGVDLDADGEAVLGGG